MEKVIAYTATVEDEARTVKQVAFGRMGLSSSALKRAKRIPEGILVSGQPVFVTHVLRAGDTVRIVLEEDGTMSALVPMQGEVCIAYEDEYLLIIDKAHGVPVHPSAGHATDSLGNLLAGIFQKRGESFVYRPVNRLDACTSGLMVVAKDPHTHAKLADMLHDLQFVRRYLALCVGAFDAPYGVVDVPIGRREGSAIARCVRADGQCARTDYHVLQDDGKTALIELKLHTGRTHQIRVHMQHIGHPLIGDFLYGTQDQCVMSRAALHAHTVQLQHPRTGQALVQTSPLPPDMQALLDRMQ